MPPKVTDARNASLLDAPPGIETGFCSFRGLEAIQRLSKQYNWRIPGRPGPTAIEKPGIRQKYAPIIQEFYDLLFPERKYLPVDINCVDKFLSSIEPSLLLYFQIEDIRARAIPMETRQAVFRYMRFHNVTLADFGLEPSKLAEAFMGYHYGIEDLDKLHVKLKLVSRLHAELHGDLRKLEKAWLLCLEDATSLIHAGGETGTVEDLIRREWGPNWTEILDSLIENFGTKSNILEEPNAMTESNAAKADPMDKSLWRIDRTGEKSAKATALADGAGILGLALAIGLDFTEALKWLRDKDGNLLGVNPSQIRKGDVFSVPNVWIACDLMRGGDLLDRVLNLGGSIGTLVGTDISTSGFRVEKPKTFTDLIAVIGSNVGFIWGIVLFAHGRPGGNLYNFANWTKLAEKGSSVGNVSSIIDSLKGNGFKLAAAYPSQCYSLYKGRVTYADQTKNGVELNERSVDWEAEWQKAAIYVHGYYGWNVAWLLDTGASNH